MPYRFDRTDTATSPEQLRQLLPRMERHQYNYTQYIAYQCYEIAGGPPMPLGKAAPWYDDFNPDQLCLPFEGFTPVEVQSVYNNFSPEFGEGWVICHSLPNTRRHREISFHERQVCARSRILSLSVFKRVEVARRADGGAPRPFDPHSRTQVPLSAHSVSVQQNSRERSRPSNDLLDVASTPDVREALLTEVGALSQINQTVTMGGDGIFMSYRSGRPVARLIRAIDNRCNRHLQFTVELRTGEAVEIRVASRHLEQARTW